jgi:hypothetical protein
LGRKWKAGTEAVGNEYKRKVEDAKRQHAIDHPDYQYQPRKPVGWDEIRVTGHASHPRKRNA